MSQWSVTVQKIISLIHLHYKRVVCKTVVTTLNKLSFILCLCFDFSLKSVRLKLNFSE